MAYIHIYILVLAVLMKNYTRFCRCLPQDYKKTINKAVQLLGPFDELNKLTMLPTPDVINEAIVGTIMMGIKSDTAALQFCDIMEHLVDTNSSRMQIQIIRNGNKSRI